jgi:pimeloyl-ACP methyl ester carboxylesterase
MSFLGTLAFGGATAAAWYTGSKKYYRFDSGADETHWIRAADGWPLAISRYLPAVGAPKRPNPVILCHGLGANRTIFDLGEKKSFARWLRDRGFDVWVVELRGHGLSKGWGWRTGRSLSWTVDDYLLRDIPALLAHVCDKTGAPQVDWVGHSQGGVLAYCMLQTPARDRIRTAVIVGSSLIYHAKGSGFDAWKKYLGWARRLPGLPMGPLLTMIAPVASRFDNPFDEFNVWPDNVDGHLNRRLLALGFDWLSVPVLLQLESAIEECGFCSMDRSVKYLEGVSQITQPVFVIGGDRDRQCPVEAKQATAEKLPAGTSRVKIFKDYGHCDLFMGKRVEDEVFPEILGWLEKPGAR